MTLKLFIHPNWHGKADKGQGGIKRVWEAQVKYLPEFGIEVVLDPHQADIIAVHGASDINIPGIPQVNHNHGMMWSRQPWGVGDQQVNADIVKSMGKAVAHTCPSEWVAVSLRRGMYIYPEVIYHGIDPEEWEHEEENQGYVLWNKARADYVSNPVDMNEVAKLLPHRQFVTTVGQEVENVKVIGGKMPYEKMKKWVMRAGVYLCTARETMGINTLEALGAGVPVAGWNWGGQREVILENETGYLAKPGEYQQLAECIERCFAERDRMSKKCVEDARARWRWRPRIQQYANLYKRTHKYYSNPRPKVSVIVTTYDMDKYLGEALESVAKQTLEDLECIVVDHCIQDSTRDIVMEWAEKDSRFKYRRTKEQVGLPGARNYGTSQAKSLYVRFLDADDRLIPNALELEANALDEDWGAHVVYGHLENINEDGSQQLLPNGDVKREGWPPDKFSWRHQMSHFNQLPSTVMMRRRVVEWSGGYRPRMEKAEDAEFWCRISSLGFRIKKITQAVTLQHRMRKGSKGAIEFDRDGTDGDWTAWFPWRFGAATYGDGHKLIRRLGREVPKKELVPFGAQGAPPEGMKCWPVHDHSYPAVSIIVTVGPGHERYLKDSLDSIAAQTYLDWECIVVNDTGREWNMKSFWDNPIAGYPWVRYHSTGGNFGVSRARNLGAMNSRGQALIWLDADDYWLPWLLERMVAMIEQHNGIIYSDIMKNIDGNMERFSNPEFECQKLVQTGQYPGSSVLVPRWVHDKVVQHQQGWDENIPGQEDWDYQLAAAVYASVCAYRVEEPLFVYRILPGGNREKHKEKLDELVEYMNEKWADYRSGKKEIMCGCRQKVAVAKPQSAGASSGATAVAQTSGVPEQTVYLEYKGPHDAPITIKGKPSNHPYRVGRMRPKIRVFTVDLPYFLTMLNADGTRQFVVITPKEELSNELVNFLDKALRPQ